MDSVLVKQHNIHKKGVIKVAWQFSSDRPIYIQMSDRIASDILMGEYPLGEKLPSVREFSVRASVNPNTVQRALAELESLGLVDNFRTTGKFVTEDEEIIKTAKEKRGRTAAEDFLKNMVNLGYNYGEISKLIEESVSKEEENNG